jgi:hypothetical protein
MNIPKVMGILIIGILIGFLLGIICIKKKNENFTVVEDDINEITINDKFLLNINKDENVKKVWGCSDFGKEMKLC